MVLKMSKNLYLHIGIWKTGTTAIQQYLYDNHKALSSAGIYYPEISSNHGFLASAFHPNPKDFIVAKSMNLAGDALVNWHASSLKAFEAGIKRNNTTIVSSEFLLDLPFENIHKLKGYLEYLFDQMTLIVYVREPVDHVSSAISEQLKHGHYGLKRALEIHSNAREFEKIKNWCDIFSNKDILLRPYSKKAFLNDSLVDDFLECLFPSGLPGNLTLGKASRKQEKNPSLSHAAVLIADKLQGITPQSSSLGGNLKYIQNIRGIKYKVPRATAKLVKENSDPFIKSLKESYGLQLDYEEISEDSAEVWADETLMSIAELINQLSARCTALTTENLRYKALEASRNKKPKLAEQYFLEAISQGEDFAVFRDYSIFLDAKGENVKALEYCDRAIELAPERTWLKTLREKLLQSAGGQ